MNLSCRQVGFKIENGMLNVIAYYPVVTFIYSNKFPEQAVKDSNGLL